jgi:perosamine synthetase
MGQKIAVAEPEIGELEEKYVADAMQSGWVSSLGPYLTRFETEFAEYCGTAYAPSVTNGTSALQIALRALGVGPGDEVLVPGLTFAAVAAVVVALGARPVLVDVEDATWCIDPDAARHAITPARRALVAVHSYGHPADLDPLLELCRANQMVLVEDCAEAHGAKYKGRTVGSIGDAGIFSFYGNKIITTGEGGIVTTSDAVLAERIRFLRDHAMVPNRRYFHSEVGYNMRLTNIQAAMGCAQLSQIDRFLAKRDEVLGWYRDDLSDCEGVSLNPSMAWAEPVNWMVCVRLDQPWASHRDDILADLASQGVDSRPFFVPLDQLPPYQDAPRVAADGSAAMPVATEVAAASFNLPSSTKLHRADVSTVCHALRSAMDRATGAPK